MVRRFNSIITNGTRHILNVNTSTRNVEPGRKDVSDVSSILKGVREATDILPCPHCTASSGSVAFENTPDSGSPLAVTPEDSLAGQLTDLSLSFGDAKLQYDDGDKELIDLKTQKWELVEDVSPILVAYCDADYAGDHDIRRSISGYVCCSGQEQFHGAAKDNQLFLYQPLKPSDYATIEGAASADQL
ncbi:hypothetical protein Tco_0323510 [Tanacetum coccineum]